MASGGSRASGLALAALLVASGCQAADVGTALLRNESGKGDLEVVVIDPQGRSGISHTMHDFADRPVCEHDVVVLGPDGSLTWE